MSASLLATSRSKISAIVGQVARCEACGACGTLQIHEAHTAADTVTAGWRALGSNALLQGFVILSRLYLGSNSGTCDDWRRRKNERIGDVPAIFVRRVAVRGPVALLVGASVQ